MMTSITPDGWVDAENTLQTVESDGNERVIE